ncbi:MAG: thioester reductase domain-containing protein [Sideroxydans sp.]|nr:thioester reductase domain-containing protein [Sideroxydans sp.]
MKPSPHADTLLDSAINPDGMASTANTVFLTGATGFLGAQVLAELLLFTGCDVICLVRADSDELAAQRLAAALEATGRACPDTAARVIALRGDVSAANFGLDDGAFDALANSVGQIIHCAAEVSWIKSYSRLRGSHINGTLNAIRLACRCTLKPLHFISTLAVCYVPGGPETVDETTDMSPHLEHIPLGYAQAKCVSETLLRQAAQRGLPVSILRCGLICGDSVSGNSNHDDLVSRLLRGAVQSGIAADVDWGLDCVPVNTVAQAVRTLVEDRHCGLRVLHLHHDEPRLWREMALWLRLNGYAVNLVALDEWLAMVGDHRGGRAPDLHVLRHFFLARPAQMGGRSLTELYLESRRRCINSAASYEYFARHGLSIPRLNAPLLNRYLARYQQQGFLPQRNAVHFAQTDGSRARAVENSLRNALHAPLLKLTEFRATPLCGSGVLSELSTISSGGNAGLWRCHIEYRHTPGDAVEQQQGVLKLRSTADEQDAATLAVAALCSPTLAAAFQTHLQCLPTRNGLARELAIAASSDNRLTRHMPRSLAVIAQSAASHGGFIEEYLEDVDLMDSANSTELWRDEHIAAAVHGLGQIHAVWYRREDELLRQPWLAPGANDFRKMHSLWRELAAFSATRFGEDMRTIQYELINDLDHWQAQWASAPRTLIHHDFNPRNLAFRRSPQGAQLCAYDWELATIGLPQYDLAELLYFVLPAAATPHEIQRWIDLHRRCLEEASGISIAQDEWQSGFTLALRQYLMCRLPLYAMIDRFQAQPFLSTVVANWLRLHRFAEGKSGEVCSVENETCPPDSTQV